MTHFQSKTEQPMTVMALVSSSPLRRTLRIGAALGWRTERNFRFRSGPRGFDFAFSTWRALDLDLGVDVGPAIDLAGKVSPELARRIAAALGSATNAFGLIEPEPEEAERLVRAIAAVAPNGTEPSIPVIDGYSPRNGLLVPIELVRNRLTQLAPLVEKGSPMPHPLQRSAPNAYTLIKQVVDDPQTVIDEFMLYELAHRQAFCKRIEHVRGDKPPRAKTLTEAEVDAVVNIQAARITSRNISEFDEPLIDPLPDGTIAVIPLLGQSNEANVVLLACFIAHGSPGSMRLSLEIDDVLPAISREVREGLGRNHKGEAAP